MSRSYEHLLQDVLLLTAALRAVLDTDELAAEHASRAGARVRAREALAAIDGGRRTAGGSRRRQPTIEPARQRQP